MNKRYFTNLGAIICVILTINCVYLLLLNNILPFSIGSMLASISHWSRHWHILVVALMPVYMGLMIFGAGMFGIYLGNMAQRFFVKFMPRRNNVSIKCKNDPIHLVRKNPFSVNSKAS